MYLSIICLHLNFFLFVWLRAVEAANNTDDGNASNSSQTILYEHGTSDDGVLMLRNGSVIAATLPKVCVENKNHGNAGCENVYSGSLSND